MNSATLAPACPTGTRHLTGLDLPYRTPDLPGIGGRIRVYPRDFRVIEIPAYIPVGAGRHLYITLSREGMTTPDVVKILSQRLHVPMAAIGYAGLKDKHALTTQTFSILCEDRDPTAGTDLQADLEAQTPFQVHAIDWHGNKLRTGHLHGNTFEILIREPACALAEAEARARAIAASLRRQGLANFFGPQRFGHEGRNVQQGWRIVYEGWRERRRWLHKLYVSAYQSYLCNQYLALRQAENGLDCMVRGDVARKLTTGGMFVVSDPQQDTKRLQAGEISFTAPMFGHKMWAAEHEAHHWETCILAQAGLEQHDWKRDRITGTRRTGLLRVPDLAVTRTPDGIGLAFSLPKGCFATTLLREMMKTPDRISPHT